MTMSGKRFLFGIMIVFLIVLAMPAFANDPITLRFLHKWPEDSWMPYWEDVVARFEKENPGIKISMEAVADEPIKEKLRVMMGGSNVPDIFFTWNGEFLNKFAKANVIRDITPYLDKDPEFRDSFVPSLLAGGKGRDGKQYGLPVRVSAKFFIYNKKVYEDAGLKVPTTWEEFLSNCEVLKQKGITPLMLGNLAPWASCHFLTTFNAMMVPEEIWRRDYDPAHGEFKDKGYIQALSMLKELNDKGYFNEGVNSTQFAQSRELFIGGTGGMIYDEMTNFKRRYEDGMPGQWDFFLCPPVKDQRGNPKLITGAPDMFAISATSEHPEEAFKFLKFIFSQENAAKFTKDTGFPNCVKGAVNGDNTIPQVVAAMKILEEASGLTGWLDTEMEAAVVDKYLGNLQQLFNGKSPEGIMQEVRDEAAFVAEGN